MMYIRTSSRDLRNKSLRWQLISINPSVGLNPCICITELLVWPWQLTVFVAFPFRSGDGCGAWLGNNLSQKGSVYESSTVVYEVYEVCFPNCTQTAPFQTQVQDQSVYFCVFMF